MNRSAIGLDIQEDVSYVHISMNTYEKSAKGSSPIRYMRILTET